MTRKILVDVTTLKALFDGGEALLLAAYECNKRK